MIGSRRLARFAAVAVVPTLVDVGLLVVLRQSLGWILVIADLTAIAVAAIVSYVLHRSADYHSNPYFRWVRYPGAFVVIAATAAVVDASVLRILYVGWEFDSTGRLLAAKAASLSAAVLLRAAGYRLVLSGRVARTRSQRVEGPPSAGDLRFSVVVPAYRAADQIATTVDRIRAELADVAEDGGLEIVVVDDGSDDATADAALAAGADQVLVHPRNLGKGGAVRTGMLATRGRVVAFTDADLAYDPSHLRLALEAIESGWDVAIGNRRHPASRVEGVASLRGAGSFVVNQLATAVLLAAPRDTQCGLKAFRGDVARDLFSRTRVNGFAFDIEVLHLVERQERTLVELPVHLVDPGGSTVRVLLDVARLVRDLFRVRRWATAGLYDRPPERTAGYPDRARW